MPLYTGCECPICGKEFESTDDVVVCPICGSPHHRECYKTVGHCGNEDYHAKNQQWEGPPLPQQEPGDVMVCRSCGTENPAGNFFCQSCGQRMGADPNAATAGAATTSGSPFVNFINTNIDLGQVLDEGVTVKDACDYVGPNNLSFILRFKELAGHKAISMNWGAFIFGFFYCFYRKMYKLGAIFLAVFLVMMIPMGYFSTVAVGEMLKAGGGAISFPMEFITTGEGYKGLMVFGGMNRIVSLASMIFCGLYFNKAYYRQMIRSVRGIKEHGRVSAGTQECTTAIANVGGVNRMVILSLLAIIFVLYLGYGYVASMILLA